MQKENLVHKEMENPDRNEVGKGSVAELNGTPESETSSSVTLNGEKGNGQREGSQSQDVKTDNGEGIGNEGCEKIKGESEEGDEEGL